MDKKQESAKDVFLRVKKNLETIFAGVNGVSEDLAQVVIDCIRDLDALSNPSSLKNVSVHKRSTDFANKHKEFCLGISQQFEDRNLQHFIHISDPLGGNTISYGHMDEPNIMKSISGAMIMSKFIFQGVLRELGMPENCVECISTDPDLKEGYELDMSKDIPQRLKNVLEEKLGGKLVAMGAIDSSKDKPFHPTVDMIVDAIKNHPEPDALLKIVAGVGPKKIIDQMLKSLGVENDFIFSKSIPNLETYPIDQLKKFEKEFADRDDPTSQFILKALRKHIARRKEETDVPGADIRKDQR